jgi:hypothetical protein
MLNREQARDLSIGQPPSVSFLWCIEKLERRVTVSLSYSYVEILHFNV